MIFMYVWRQYMFRALQQSSAPHICLWAGSVTSETILVHVNNVEKYFPPSAKKNAWGGPWGEGGSSPPPQGRKTRGGGEAKSLGGESKLEEGGSKSFSPVSSIVTDVFCWRVHLRHQIFPKKDSVLLSTPDYLNQRKLNYIHKNYNPETEVNFFVRISQSASFLIKLLTWGSNCQQIIM